MARHVEQMQRPTLSLVEASLLVLPMTFLPRQNVSRAQVRSQKVNALAQEFAKKAIIPVAVGVAITGFGLYKNLSAATLEEKILSITYIVSGVSCAFGACFNGFLGSSILDRVQKL